MAPYKVSFYFKHTSALTASSVCRLSISVGSAVTTDLTSCASQASICGWVCRSLKFYEGGMLASRRSSEAYIWNMMCWDANECESVFSSSWNA